MNCNRPNVLFISRQMTAKMQPKIRPETAQVPSDEQASLTGNELRVALTKDKICQAVAACLDEFGYSETSINRVQNKAGVSRGALTHHFPSKEAMMVETLERLLDPVRGRTTAPQPAMPDILRIGGQGNGIQSDLLRLWKKVVNTREGRALVEILVAARTDRTLHQQIAPSLHAYNAEISDNIASLYQTDAGQNDEIPALWSICRVFLRGLHTHSPFEQDPKAIDAMIARFGEIMAPHMLARNPAKVPGK